jgi:hypothetical protein
VSLERLCVIINCRGTRGWPDGESSEMEKWTTLTGSYINKVPIECELRFYDMYSGDALAADWLLMYTRFDCVPRQ